MCLRRVFISTCSAMARARLAEGPREHRGKCGGRARQPRGQLTGCLWELPPSFSCRGSHAPPRSGACRLTARHGGAHSAQGTQGAPRKMQRQGAATPGSTHRVSVGCAPSLRLPRQPQTAPLRRLPPAPLPIALRLKNNNNNDVQRQNSCNTAIRFCDVKIGKFRISRISLEHNVFRSSVKLVSQ